MGSINGASSTSLEKAVGDLFFTGNGFRFSNDAKAYQHFSRELSKLAGRPVIVVNLGDLPHAYADQFAILAAGDKLFTPKQIRERAQALRRICEATFSGDEKKIWRRFNLAFTAAKACPTADTLSANLLQQPESLLPARMEGEFWNRAAIVLVPDRRWSEKTMWSFLTGLSEDEIKRYPRGEGFLVLSFFHEMSHILQRFVSLFNKDTPSSVTWAHEKDADEGSVDMASILAKDPRCPTRFARSIRLAIALEAPVRALSRFLLSPDAYDTALAIGRHINGQTAPVFDAVRAAGEELLWRSYTTMHGILAAGGRPMSEVSDSKITQVTVNAYSSGDLHDLTLSTPIWKACFSPRERLARLPLISALQEVMTQHPITDPLTKDEGGLALRAAKFFCPNLFTDKKMDCVPKVKITGHFDSAASGVLKPTSGNGSTNTHMMDVPISSYYSDEPLPPMAAIPAMQPDTLHAA